eukprot:1137818-Pelagomonas_calceolata.AAC.4
MSFMNEHTVDTRHSLTLSNSQSWNIPTLYHFIILLGQFQCRWEFQHLRLATDGTLEDPAYSTAMNSHLVRGTSRCQPAHTPYGGHMAVTKQTT